MSVRVMAAAMSLRCSVRRLFSSEWLHERSVSSSMNISHACMPRSSGAAHPQAYRGGITSASRLGQMQGMHWSCPRGCSIQTLLQTVAQEGSPAKDIPRMMSMLAMQEGRPPLQRGRALPR